MAIVVGCVGLVYNEVCNITGNPYYREHYLPEQDPRLYPGDIENPYYPEVVPVDQLDLQDKLDPLPPYAATAIPHTMFI